jgi:hypothetical protein
VGAADLTKRETRLDIAADHERAAQQIEELEERANRPRLRRLRQRSTLTGVDAALFVGGALTLLIALYHYSDRTGSLWAVGLGILAASFFCWTASAKWGLED